LFQSTSQFRCFRKLRRFKSSEFKIKKLKWSRTFLKTIKFHKNINPYDLHQFQNIWRKFNSINFSQSLVRFEEKLFSRFHIVEKNNVRSDGSRGAVGWASAIHGRCLPMVTGSIPGPVGTFLHNFFAFLEKKGDCLGHFLKLFLSSDNFPPPIGAMSYHGKLEKKLLCDSSFVCETQFFCCSHLLYKDKR